MSSKSKMIVDSYPTMTSPFPAYDSLVSNSYDDILLHSPIPSPDIKSQSIPISEGLYKTASEVQLCLDEEVAEKRDYAFYSRVVTGISQSQGGNKSWQCQQDNHMCLLHVMQTRNNSQAKLYKDENGWALGQTLENKYDEKILRDIASEAVALTTGDVDEGIFDLDL
jgi:hypothetical protein